MTILLVDDEQPAVQAVHQMLDWRALGFDEVLEANSLAQAQAVLNGAAVQVVVCDVEMPGGSGIELVRWLRENYPLAQAILLTAHQRFEYARAALGLGVQDYLLKPARPDELRRAVEQARDRVRRQGELERYREYGDLWLESRPLVAERFWLDIINGLLPADADAIGQAAARRHIGFDAARPVLPVLLRKPSGGAAAHPAPDAAQGLRAALEGVYQQVDLLLAGEALMCAIAYGGAPGAREAVQALDAFVRGSGGAVGPAVYVDAPVLAQALPAAVEKLLLWDRDNVRGAGGLFDGSASTPAALRLPLPDYPLWQALLAQGRGQALRGDILAYKRQVEGYRGVDAQFMLRMHHDFLQMAYAALEERAIPTHALLDDARAAGAPQSLKTIDDLFRWVLAVADTAAGYLSGHSAQPAVMDRLAHYVDAHLAEDLGREELAAQFSLNPDYLSRVVKKETGLPLSEYVQRRRMEVAAELLRKTDLPVGEVALRVGYRHFSQFGKIFKKHTGQGPREFRGSEGQNQALL